VNRYPAPGSIFLNDIAIDESGNIYISDSARHMIYRFADGQFDLSWNFVTWTELDDPPRYLLEMKRISNNYVLLVTCNNFQPGYPWHRLIHKIYGFPWTHGQTQYNHITRVRRIFKGVGLKVVECGAIDTPGWPDPSGPRDIRLHKNFGKHTEKPNWEVPIIKYAKNGRFPKWMRALGKWDMAFRKGIFKLPMSHLFYVSGKALKGEKTVTRIAKRILIP